MNHRESTTPLTLDLHDDLEATLTEEAARLGMSVSDYADSLARSHLTQTAGLLRHLLPA